VVLVLVHQMPTNFPVYPRRLCFAQINNHMGDPYAPFDLADFPNILYKEWIAT